MKALPIVFYEKGEKKFARLMNHIPRRGDFVVVKRPNTGEPDFNFRVGNVLWVYQNSGSVEEVRLYGREVQR